MRVFNKRARFEFEITLEKIEAGIALRGAEAKALKMGRGEISHAFVKIIGNEVFLVNANIPVAGIKNYDPGRSRKLLLHRSEIISLITKGRPKSLQLVPLSLYTKGRLIKLQLALGKPKRKYEKRESIRRKDINRDVERELRGKS